jgi:predicted O-methyltransferase YrrM
MIKTIKKTKDGIKFFTKKTNRESSIDFIFNNSCMSIQQNREEFEELIKIYREIKNPQWILEIGSYKGGSLYIFSRQSKKLNMISIDYPVQWTRLKNLKTFLKKVIIKSIPLKNQKVYSLMMDSHSKKTIKEVKQIIGKDKIDFIFVDGDHSYCGVKSDFKMYSKLLSEKGVICFHDIYSAEGVIKFWKEIKKKYSVKEIVANDERKRIGIGIIYGSDIRNNLK